MVREERETRWTLHLLDRQFEVASGDESNEDDGQRDEWWWIRMKWDHPQRWCPMV